MGVVGDWTIERGTITGFSFSSPSPLRDVLQQNASRRLAQNRAGARHERSSCRATCVYIFTASSGGCRILI